MIVPDVWGIGSILTKFLLYMGLFVGTGNLMVGMLFASEVASLGRRLRFTGAAFAAMALLMAVFNFALGGAILMDDVSGMYDPSILRLLWDTAPGGALLMRVVGLILLIEGLLFGGYALWSGLLGAFITLASFATIGHIAGTSEFWLQAILMLHLLVAAFWIGILGPLRALSRNQDTMVQAANLGHRFGNVAAIAVPMLLIAGTFMSWRLVGNFSSLFSTNYGQFLIVKIVAVCLLLVLAALNKTRFVPGLRQGSMTAGAGLARSIQFEWVCIWVILFATAIFTSILSLPK